MSVPHRLEVKYFLEPGAAIEPGRIIPIFHDWIRSRSVDGLLIDVADYRHVPDGPGVILVGHDVDYALDFQGRVPGLRHVRKVNRIAGDLPLADHLAALLANGWQACQALRDLAQFRPQPAEITLTDRLRAPNRPETHDRLRPGVHRAAEAVFGRPVKVESVARDPREPLTFRLTAAEERPEGARHG